MDFRITIQDENRNTLQEINVYQDGSDSAGAEMIADYIRDNFSIDFDREGVDCTDCDDSGCIACTGY